MSDFKPKQSRYHTATFRCDKNDCRMIIENSLEQVALNRVSTFRWILHDKDVYREEDAKEYNELHKQDEDFVEVHAGEPKPNHIHCIWGMFYPVYSNNVARRIGLPKADYHMIHSCSSREASIEYLVHKNDPDKHQYSYDEVQGTGLEAEALYNSDTEAVKATIYKISNGAMTLRQALDFIGANLFVDNERSFRHARGTYLLYKAQLPVLRVNILLTGPGGIGKDLGAHMLAQAMCPDMRYEDAVYEINDLRVALDNYDGQPIIIWEDLRAEDILKKFGANVFYGMLDTKPKRTAYNIKYGTTTLINSLNIFTTSQDAKEFTDIIGSIVRNKDTGFITSYKEEPKQTLRRIPIICPMSEEFIEIYTNNGWFKNTDDYLTYSAYGRIVGNYADVMRHRGLPEDVKQETLNKLTEPLITVVNDAVETYNQGTDEPLPDGTGDFIKGE